MPAWVDFVVKLTPAFVALVVGLFGTWIAYAQHKTSRDKLRFDLFAKRSEVFEKLSEFFASLLREGCCKDETLPLLLEARSKSRFLFGSEIEEYFDTLWAKATRLRALRRRLYGPNALPVGSERSTFCQEESDLLDWNTEQIKTSRELFAPYLKFDK